MAGGRPPSHPRGGGRHLLTQLFGKNMLGGHHKVDFSYGRMRKYMPSIVWQKKLPTSVRRKDNAEEQWRFSQLNWKDVLDRCQCARIVWGVKHGAANYWAQTPMQSWRPATGWTWRMLPDDSKCCRQRPQHVEIFMPAFPKWLMSSDQSSCEIHRAKRTCSSFASMHQSQYKRIMIYVYRYAWSTSNGILYSGGLYALWFIFIAVRDLPQMRYWILEACVDHYLYS